MNLPTALVSLAVLALLAAIVARGVYDRRHGKAACPCGGDCGHCKGCH